jgi:acetyltransferase
MRPPDFEYSWELDDGTAVTIRTMRPDDAQIEQDFVRSLSPRSKTLRFFSPIEELSATALEKFTHTDFPNEMALVATVDQNGIEHEVGVARYAPGTCDGQVEFAVVVSDDWQGKGIATELLRHLFSIASEVGINSIEGFILRDSIPMLRLAREFGFRIQPDKEDRGIAHAFKDVQMQAGKG